mmetsp:Transcript_25695/g.55286  ORF Transcript_25695/g.55286 Transcript_25695/m.55286 type:complete len:219 (+) Transcript_25695:274-930(+)
MVHTIVLVALCQHEMNVMIRMCCLARNRAKEWGNSVQKQKCRIPARRHALGVGGLTGLVRMNIRRMIHYVEPKRTSLTDPHGRIGDKQPLATKIAVSHVQFCRTNRKGPRVKKPQQPSIIVFRGKLFLHIFMSHTEERKRPLHSILYRTVRIAGQITMLVMTPMLRRPPYRTALVSRTPQYVEEETHGRRALERGMGGVAVETYRHADANSPHGNEKR